jgi:hypothetical protein
LSTLARKTDWPRLLSKNNSNISQRTKPPPWRARA